MDGDKELVHYLKGGKGSNCRSFRKEYSGYSGVVRHRLQNLNIENWGQSYASVKTFLDSGRFSGMLQQVNKNDYVIIALAIMMPDVNMHLSDNIRKT